MSFRAYISPVRCIEVIFVELCAPAIFTDWQFLRQSCTLTDMFHFPVNWCCWVLGHVIWVRFHAVTIWVFSPGSYLILFTICKSSFTWFHINFKEKTVVSNKIQNYRVEGVSDHPGLWGLVLMKVLLDRQVELSLQPDGFCLFVHLTWVTTSQVIAAPQGIVIKDFQAAVRAQLTWDARNWTHSLSVVLQRLPQACLGGSY